MSQACRKLSVVMPVYNAADYLNESISDLLVQSYSDFELICVNDGSTDDSKKIIEDFCEKDNRIRLISQENLGGGAARNAGFDESDSEYVLFLDADDRFEDTLIEKIIKDADQKKCDVLIFAADEFDYETKKKSSAPWLLQSGYEEYDGNPFHYTTTTVWNKLFRRDYLMNHDIRHQDERVTAFSMYFTFFALFCAQKISFLDEVLVHYRKDNPHSSMKRHDSSPLDTLIVMEKIWKRINNSAEMLKKKHIYLNFAIKNVFDRTGWFNSYEGFAEVYESLHTDGFLRIGLTEDNDELIEDRDWIKEKKLIMGYSLPEYLFYREKKYKSSGVLTKTVYLLPVLLCQRLKERPCRIVLYGGGMVGKSYFPQLRCIVGVDVVAWVDGQFAGLGYPVQSPDILKDLDFDYVLLGIEHKRFLSEIEDKLGELGIPKSKVLWEAPRKQL